MSALEAAEAAVVEQAIEAGRVAVREMAFDWYCPSDPTSPRHTCRECIGEIAAAAAVAAYRATQDGGAEETLRNALRVHHPIMRSETGPFSGCRCGQVKLGQDVIGHVTDHLRAALADALDPS